MKSYANAASLEKLWHLANEVVAWGKQK